MSEITEILARIERGEPSAPQELLPLVYEELRKLAAARMSQECPDHTLQATALVHEAYLRLVTPEPTRQWEGRGHFFAAAAEAMRRILVDNARRKNRIKNGGNFVRQPIDDIPLVESDVHEDLVALDEALKRLESVDTRAVQLVNLRYFAGLSNAEAAQMLDISARTADRIWAFTRAWLHQEIAADAGEKESE